MFSCEICEILKNTFPYRTTNPVAASVYMKSFKLYLICAGSQLRIIKWINNNMLKKNELNVQTRFSYNYDISGSRTIVPEENCPPDKCPQDNCPLDDCPSDYCLRTIALEDNCLRGKLPPGKLPPCYKISSKNNCPHLNNSPQRVLRVNWKLCIVYE